MKGLLEKKTAKATWRHTGAGTSLTLKHTHRTVGVCRGKGEAQSYIYFNYSCSDQVSDVWSRFSWLALSPCSQRGLVLVQTFSYNLQTCDVNEKHIDSVWIWLYLSFVFVFHYKKQKQHIRAYCNKCVITLTIYFCPVWEKNNYKLPEIVLDRLSQTFSSQTNQTKIIYEELLLYSTCDKQTWWKTGVIFQ